MRKLDAGVGNEATPVPRMRAALARFDGQVEVEAPARAEEHGRTIRAQPWSVRGDQQIGLEERLVLLAYLAQARRAGLLAHLDQHLGVEAEPPTLAEHVRHRLHVDGVLTLVVGDAAAVPAAI